jgi:tripartite ATP-independent transporter DctM subunit
MSASATPDPPKLTLVEIVATVLLTMVMVMLPVLEALMRLIRGVGIPGSFKYVQHGMVWLGFVGAIIATGSGRHLGLSTAQFFKEPRRKLFAQVLCNAISALTCLVLAYAGYMVVKANSEGTDMLVGGIPAWWSEIIVPVALSVICLRFIWTTEGGWKGRAISLGTVVLGGLVFWLLRDKAPGASIFWPCMIMVAVAFILGAPVFVVMGGMAMLLFWRDQSPIASVLQETIRLAQKDALPAIPILTMVGYVLAVGGASQRIVRAYKGLFGWLPGGVSLMVIVVSAAFTTLTGGSGVTILALGGLMYPALVKDKYPGGFSMGLVTASGSLGLLFFPSLPVILYAVVAGIDSKKLFLAGALPGAVLMVVVAIWAVFVGVRAGAPRQKFEVKEALAALWAAKWDVGLPVVIAVPFLTGRGLIVESAALGALYALLVELIVFRDVHPWKRMPRVMAESAMLVGAVIILMGMALGFTNYLIDAQIGEALTDWAQAHIKQQWIFLLALNAMLLVLGSVFEIYAAIIVLAPLVAPLGVAFNVDPLHLGVVFLANLELGFLFPPMGLNLFLSASRFGMPLPSLYRYALPFLLIMAVGVLIITYVPAMTTGVVNLLSK